MPSLNIPIFMSRLKAQAGENALDYALGIHIVRSSLCFSGLFKKNKISLRGMDQNLNWTKSLTHRSDNAHSTGYLMLRHDICIKEFYQFKKKNHDCHSARKMTHKMLRTMFVMSRYNFSSYSHHRIFPVSNRAKWQRLLMTPLFVLF